MPASTVVNGSEGRTGTKQYPYTTKQYPFTTKQFPFNTKQLIEATTAEYSDVGADGLYEVRLAPPHDPIPVRAIAIRVLAHGELNLLTDEGRWFLFAPTAWQRVTPVPESPVCEGCARPTYEEPGQCPTCGYRPKDEKAAQK